MSTRTRLVLSLAVATTCVLAACVPETPGAPPPVTLVPPPECVPTEAPALAGVSARGTNSTADELDRDEVLREVDRAAEESLGADGSGEVVVVTLDESGRPEFATAPAAEAPELATELSDDDDVRVVAVDAVKIVGIAEPGPAATSAPIADDPRRAEQWGMTDLQVEDAWQIATGSDVDIAVVDTGVRASHPDFDGRICWGASYLNDATVPTIGGGSIDGNGHGTHVAGTAAAGAFDQVGVVGVAPDARIIPVRVLGSNGTGYSTDVGRGIVWSVDHGADVINLSLGGPDSSDITAAVDYAHSHGVVVVAAAGNDGPASEPNYPAAIPSVLAVASYDENRSISSFSSHGAYVDVAAPGRNILSTASNGGFTLKSGTSMATPHVAGLAALLLESEPGLDPAAVRGRIEGTATDAGAPGHDVAFGHGIVTPLEMLNP